MNELPIKLKNCPIKEAIFEVRFESTFPPGAVFGIGYNALKEKYANFEPLPITQLPESVRDSDPDLFFQPHYRAKRDTFVVQIGPRILSINSIEPYPGWDNYKSEILSVLEAIKSSNLVSGVARIGLRYRNVFANQILKDINFNVRINDLDVTNPETSFRTVFDEDNGFKTILQIAGEVAVKEADGSTYTGSLIDIDVSFMAEEVPFLENPETFLEITHSIEKTHFFALLKHEFLQSFEPVYGDGV